jgi:hypothetical protein
MGDLFVCQSGGDYNWEQTPFPKERIRRNNNIISSRISGNIEGQDLRRFLVDYDRSTHPLSV